MKPVNFLKTASARQQQAVRFWILLSAIVIASTALILYIIYRQQIVVCTALTNQKQELAQQLKTFDTIMAQKQTHKSRQDVLNKKLLKITHHTQQPKNPAALLKNIKATLKDQATIESFSMAGKNIEIRIGAQNSATLMKIADALAQQKPCAGMSITSLEHKDTNRMMAVLKAQNVKKKVS